MSLRRTPFFSHHQAAGGRLIDFGGWELPVQYSSIMEEHKCVRDSVGLFDVSHMGEVFLRGPSALAAVEVSGPPPQSSCRPLRMRAGRSERC